MFRALKRHLKAKATAFDARRAFVVALLLAFVLQGQLVASHFHALNTGSTPQLSADAGTVTIHKDQKQAPVGDDCPICHQLSGAHNLLLHAVASLSLPDLIGAQPVAIFDERAPNTTLAFNWRSRAPPSPTFTS